MCKFKVLEGWNCGRLIITVIVSLVSIYKDNFVNDKANTWDDPICGNTNRPNFARSETMILSMNKGTTTIVEHTVFHK